LRIRLAAAPRDMESAHRVNRGSDMKTLRRSVRDFTEVSHLILWAPERAVQRGGVGPQRYQRVTRQRGEDARSIARCRVKEPCIDDRGEIIQPAIGDGGGQPHSWRFAASLLSRATSRVS